MRLVPLFEGELIFDETTEVAFPSYGEDGDWFGYVQGHGSIEGERLSGELRWTNHPRCRADGTWLPNYQGTIATVDGANLLFCSRGYNEGIGDPFGKRAPLGALQPHLCGKRGAVSVGQRRVCCARGRCSSVGSPRALADQGL
jgi:hypothetical protein